MIRPKVLDLFACEGGASVGYDRAGFDVYAVDLDENRLSCNPYAKHLGDALEVMRTLLDGGEVMFFHPPNGRSEFLKLEDFVLLHASPPCQGYSRGNAGKETAWPKLIPGVRDLFTEAGVSYVIENVRDAGPAMVGPVALCGCMFETSWDMAAPRRCDDSVGYIAGAYGGSRRAKRGKTETLAEVAPRDRYESRHVRKGGYVPRSKDVLAALLGIEHNVTLQGLKESIPPAYAEYVGRQLLARLEAVTAA